ncbi:MAG: DUF2703 domain-containing protein [Elusimicrobiota bacterium]|nr:DUF2703 domain-containing protein [Elusimicrobiota bacterium]
MKSLEIKWQRLIYKNKTCPRCAKTENEIKKTVSLLKEVCRNTGIKFVLKKEKISKNEFIKNPLKSNQIFINNKPLEEYLNAKISKTKCCDVCGPVECRTVVLDKTQFEVIPKEIIIKAGIIAISEILKGAYK